MPRSAIPGTSSQQTDSFGFEQSGQYCVAGRVAPWSVEALDQTGLNWIVADSENDGDRGSRLLRGKFGGLTRTRQARDLCVSLGIAMTLEDSWGGDIATAVEVCEQRDRKGLYAKARAGILKEFTGISDPYEVPADADVTINTGELSPEEAAQEIILHLEREGFIGVNGPGS
jgi:hypothetical protein